MPPRVLIGHLLTLAFIRRRGVATAMRLGIPTIALALVGLVLATPATATIGTIQPGDQSVSGGAGCTLNFVFDGVGALAGKVYMGTAAHCVSAVGDSVSSWPYDGFGTVAIIGSADSASTDWGFIEVMPEFHRFVKAAVKGHPTYPTGVATRTETSEGDLLQFSGYGMGFGTTAPTQEKRVGALAAHERDRVLVVGPVIFGDSGGPVVHIPTGKAISLQSRLCVGPCSEVGPNYEDILAQAARSGFTVQLRTV